MTYSEKLKTYIDYYKMANDWPTDFLYKAFKNLVGLDCDSCRIKRNCIVDILWSRGLVDDCDFFPYCKVLGVDEVIGYGSDHK